MPMRYLCFVRRAKRRAPSVNCVAGPLLRGSAAQAGPTPNQYRKSTERMKTQTILLSLTALFVAGEHIDAQSAPSGKKALVVYFSHSGNTRLAAERLAAAAGADLFEIVPATPYPAEYGAVVDQAKREIAADYRPALATDLHDIAAYDVIYVGSPCWWSTVAPPVATFLAAHDFAGKTLVPFMTHEGSRMGRTEADLRRLCPDATVLAGVPIRGSAVAQADREIRRLAAIVGR